MSGAKKRVPARCGTASGYSRHRRHGETPCDPCRAAHSAACRERKQRLGHLWPSRVKPPKEPTCPPDSMRSTAAARHLGVGPHTLHNWRQQGIGPPWSQTTDGAGTWAAVYRVADPDAFLAERARWEKLLTRAEASEMAGVAQSRLAASDVPSFRDLHRPGYPHVYRREDIQAWMAQREREAEARAELSAERAEARRQRYREQYRAQAHTWESTIPATPYGTRMEQRWRQGGNDRERPPSNWVRRPDGTYRSMASGRIVKDPGLIARIEARQQRQWKAQPKAPKPTKARDVSGWGPRNRAAHTAGQVQRP